MLPWINAIPRAALGVQGSNTRVLVLQHPHPGAGHPQLLLHPGSGPTVPDQRLRLQPQPLCLFLAVATGRCTDTVHGQPDTAWTAGHTAVLHPKHLQAELRSEPSNFFRFLFVCFMAVIFGVQFTIAARRAGHGGERCPEGVGHMPTMARACARGRGW